MIQTYTASIRDSKIYNSFTKGPKVKEHTLWSCIKSLGIQEIEGLNCAQWSAQIFEVQGQKEEKKAHL